MYRIFVRKVQFEYPEANRVSKYGDLQSVMTHTRGTSGASTKSRETLREAVGLLTRLSEHVEGSMLITVRSGRTHDRTVVAAVAERAVVSTHVARATRTEGS